MRESMKKKGRRQSSSVSRLDALLLVLAFLGFLAQLVGLWSASSSSLLTKHNVDNDDQRLSTDFERLKALYVKASSDSRSSSSTSQENNLALNSYYHEYYVDTDEQQHLSFRLENLDLTSGRVACGRFKCFVPLLTSTEIGYLVVLGTKSWHLIGQWNATQYLAEHYADTGFRHLLRGPPTEALQIDDSLVHALNQHSSLKYKADQFSNTIAVQQTIVAPSPSIVLKCSRKFCNRVLRFLLWHWILSGTTTLATVATQQLRIELNHALKLLTQEPWLAPDFQLLIDGMTGRTYFIDVGRGKGFWGKKQKLKNLWQGNGYQHKTHDERKAIRLISECHDELSRLLANLEWWKNTIMAAFGYYDQLSCMMMIVVGD